MKKVFKGSLLAASVAMAFGAQAADIRPADGGAELSKQGLSVGLTSTDDIVFDVAVSETHPSQSDITLTFSETVDLSGIDVTEVDSNAGDFTDVQFDYGNGVFTFDSVAVDTDENTITFSVATGNPIAQASSFTVTVTPAAVAGAATVNYSSEYFGDAVESGSGTVASVSDQYGVALAGEFDQLIERVNRDTFVDTTTEDSIAFTYSEDATLAAAATTGDHTLVLAGDFSGRNAADWEIFSDDTCTTQLGTPAAGTVSAEEDEVSFTIAAGDLTDGTTYYMCYSDDGTGSDFVATSFELTATQAFDDGGAPAETGSVELASGADVGEWQLDASVVNVPYLPVNYGLTPNVEIANEGSNDAEIIVEAIDNEGNELGPVTLDFAANGNTVTKVSEADLDEAFGLEGESRKLSVTFIIDADAEDITLAPYYRENESRINVITDQYKGQ